MSRYERLALNADDDDENMLLDGQIQELSKLKDYEYFWRGFNILGCKNVNFMNKKFGFIYTLDQKINGEWRCLCYIFFLPLILMLIIFKIFK